jgi:hypothetical protein
MDTCLKPTHRWKAKWLRFDMKQNFNLLHYYSFRDLYFYWVPGDRFSETAIYLTMQGLPERSLQFKSPSLYLIHFFEKFQSFY